MAFTRYGIYATPRPGVFADAGATWLGWDISRGQPVGQPDDAITKRPRKYGFHGTIKPPFHLAPGKSVGDLEGALSALCAQVPPIALEGMTLSRLGAFLALTPTGDTRDLAAMAATVVRELDSFRAPPTAEETARRRRADLTPLQQENLQKWGYPYVMDAFRFHMTLTGPLPAAQFGKVMADANGHFENVPLRPYVMDSLTLVGEADGGMFQEIHRYTLTGK